MSLLLFFLLYFALTFAWRSTLVYRRTGVNPLVLPARDDAYGYVGRAFKVTIGIVAVYVGLAAFVPKAIDSLGVIHALNKSAVSYIGWVMLWGSLAWLLVAQAQMGNSWRIGIDEHRQTSLVSSGLFALSRNPIFLGMRFTMLGLVLVSPTAFTVAVAVAAELLIQVQVRLEEAHLLSLHGEEYTGYSSRVRRWL
jgi:protein-S-isoprenylcysteine O-methyltransferase Ste14